jgi:hypothetical protein
LYEVVENANLDGKGGTVLNIGGTAYNSPVKVSLAKILKANSQPIKLTLRDKNKLACIENVTVQSDPFRLPCKTLICVPLTTKKI